MTLPKQVTLIEVGPRDGLQNESRFIPTDKKVTLINQLSQSGLSYIEATSFVSPKAIPQLADAIDVMQQINRVPNVCYSALVPNMKGLEAALMSKVNAISVFTAASESFNQRNINCSIDESIKRFLPVIKEAKAYKLPVRGYISCVLGCPYEGTIKPEHVLDVMQQLLDAGVDEISLGDTIGVGTAKQTSLLLEQVLQHISINKIAMHFHDTYGQAIANILASLQLGIYRFDSSVAGLGGCPYARGASGNVATEDVLYLLHGLGIETGIDIYKIVEAGEAICRALNKKNQSKVASALLAQSCQS